MLAINTKLSEYEEVYNIAEAYPNIWASVGVHPHAAEEEPNIAFDQLLMRAAKKRCVGIGETGLDYFYDKAPRDLQQANFRTHIRAARAVKQPIIVHSRDAEDDTYSIMAEEMEKGAYTGVIHCFTASADFAKKVLDLGLYISLSGIVTFKNAKDLQQFAKWVPLDRILVETDAPYLAPLPHRGKPNAPAYTRFPAEKLAEIKGVSFDDVARAATDNFFALFTKASRAEVQQACA